MLIAFLLLAAPLSAQRTQLQREEITNFRASIIEDVLRGDRNAASAIAHLKGRKAASNFSFEGDGALGLAAIDIGKRLELVGDRASAQLFFEEAEKALIKAARTKSTTLEQKVIFLQKLATIQATNLNNPRAARANLDQAMELAPDSKNLENLYARLSTRHRDEFPFRERKPQASRRGDR